jgi:hypothetical protein
MHIKIVSLQYMMLMNIWIYFKSSSKFKNPANKFEFKLESWNRKYKRKLNRKNRGEDSPGRSPSSQPNLSAPQPSLVPFRSSSTSGWEAARWSTPRRLIHRRFSNALDGGRRPLHPIKRSPPLEDVTPRLLLKAELLWYVPFPGSVDSTTVQNK